MVIATFKYVAQTAATTFAFPSVWFLFYGMHCTRLTSSHIYSQWGTPDVVRACWHDLIHMCSEAPLTWCVHADMTLNICAVRRPWRGACTLTWPYTHAQWGAPDVVRACWHDLIHMRSEAPLTWCVHADRTGCVCNMCLNNFTVIIPCPGCVSVAYCSTACRQKVRPM